MPGPRSSSSVISLLSSKITSPPGPLMTFVTPSTPQLSLPVGAKPLALSYSEKTEVGVRVQLLST